MNFLELLDEYYIPYITTGHEHSRPGWVQLTCPCCAKEGHWRLGYNLRTGLLNCWSCGKVSVSWFLRKTTGLTFTECKELARELGVTGRFSDPEDGSPTPKSPQAPKTGVETGALKLPTGLGPLKPYHSRYLLSRGFDPKQLSEVWGVQGIGIHWRLAHRIFIPITHKGEIVSWTTRSLTDEPPRYLTARKSEEKISCKKVLFGADLVKGNTAIIVEGPMSAMMVGPGAVATLGTGFSQEQVNLIGKYQKRIICMDAEPEGQKAAERLIGELSAFSGKTINVILESAKDAADCNKKELNQLRRML